MFPPHNFHRDHVSIHGVRHLVKRTCVASPRHQPYETHSRLLHEYPLTVVQDLKDFARSSGQLDVVYSETGRERDGKG